MASYHIKPALISATTVSEGSHKKLFDKGNYKGYYKIRSGEDHRLELFKSSWFKEKLCLDVGCNEGSLTLQVAERYRPRMILGIDIDFTLIECAQSKVKRKKYDLARKNIPVSRNSLLFVPRSVTRSKPSSSLVGAESFPSNIHFARRDVLSMHTSSHCDSSCSGQCSFEVSHEGSNGGASSCGRYDTILCLSVTKWVHLNGGDEQLLRLFRKLYELLVLGGRLVLEYQPWKSYERNKNASETTKRVFPTIDIRPEDFEEVLVGRIGFTVVERLGPTVQDAKGFYRPLLVLKRPSEMRRILSASICSNPTHNKPDLSNSEVATVDGISGDDNPASESSEQGTDSHQCNLLCVRNNPKYRSNSLGTTHKRGASSGSAAVASIDTSNRAFSNAGSESELGPKAKKTRLDLDSVQISRD